MYITIRGYPCEANREKSQMQYKSLHCLKSPVQTHLSCVFSCVKSVIRAGYMEELVG